MSESIEQSAKRAWVEVSTLELFERLARAWEAMQLAKALATQHEKEMFEQLATIDALKGEDARGS